MFPIRTRKFYSFSIAAYSCGFGIRQQAAFFSPAGKEKGLPRRCAWHFRCAWYFGRIANAAGYFFGFMLYRNPAAACKQNSENCPQKIAAVWARPIRGALPSCRSTYKKRQRQQVFISSACGLPLPGLSLLCLWHCTRRADILPAARQISQRKAPAAALRSAVAWPAGLWLMPCLANKRRLQGCCAALCLLNVSAAFAVFILCPCLYADNEITVAMLRPPVSVSGLPAACCLVSCCGAPGPSFLLWFCAIFLLAAVFCSRSAPHRAGKIAK